MALHMRGHKELDSVVVKGVEVGRGMTVRVRADGKERELLVTDIREDQHGQYMLLFRSVPNHAGKNYLVQSEHWELLTPIECGVAPVRPDRWRVGTSDRAWPGAQWRWAWR
jgi:hypothetical protein